VRDAGVVDEDIESLEVATDGAEAIVDRLRVAKVAGVGEDLDFYGREFPANATEGGFVAAGDDQIAACAGEGEADAAVPPVTRASWLRRGWL